MLFVGIVWGKKRIVSGREREEIGRSLITA